MSQRPGLLRAPLAGRIVLLAARVPIVSALPLLASVPLSSTALSAQSAVPFRPGMVVTGSVRIEPGTYQVPAPVSLDSALIVVRGHGTTLDLDGVRLEGIHPEADPDQARGVAIRIEGGNGVVVSNAHIRGYRIAILAVGTRDLTLLDNELSYNWKPRLFSLVEHESLLDWLSYHRNDNREWMRFGAAIYLENVRGGEVRGNRAVQGMNGLLMTRTDSVTVRDNEFAYNSGLGVGLYRSSGNTLVRNRLDYNVRGYSHGFYRRGQDSAGILLYEQSSGNVVAYNSASHSGDGLFLWAGQHTMDTGEGGANDNLFFHNDFSFAPTNGMETTFSRNRLVANLVEGSDYGLWGGYSYDSEVLGNCFADNRVGVAIEHGQDNRITGNRFEGDSTAIALWANPTEPEDWGYPRHRDTHSRDTRVADNVFVANPTVWRLENTTGLDAEGNQTLGAPPAEPCQPRALLGEAFDSLAPALPRVPQEIPTSERARLPRSAIVVDEWGPYDARSPKLWPVDTTRAAVRLAVLGPEGRWRVTERRGVAGLSSEAGATGDTVVVTPAAEALGDWAVQLEYKGAATVSPRGEVGEAGVPVRFSYEWFEASTDWEVRFFAWTDSASDPWRNPEAFERMVAGPPAFTRREPRLDYVWYRPAIPELPQERWALEATTSVEVPPGEYSLQAISDDAVRVWQDGALVIDHWEPHESTVDYAPITEGRHRLRVRYYQIRGWSEIRVDIVRGSSRSTGSPAPH